MMGYHDGWSGGWLAMALMMLLFWGGLAAIVAWVVHTLRPPRAAEPTAGRILDERYARGEIDDEEYRRRRGVLTGS